jgi:hypothetical protein
LQNCAGAVLQVALKRRFSGVAREDNMALGRDKGFRLCYAWANLINVWGDSMGFWSSIDTEEKRARWVFIGGGVATVAAAVWAVFVYFSPPKSSLAPPGRSVTATDESVVFGGNVSGSKITITHSVGLPLKDSNTEQNPKAKQ